MGGACHFPPGSRIADLDTIDIDCDWTPSLHLNDAALNISLKVRESIKRSEPFYRKDEFEMAMDVVADTVAASSAKVSSFFNSLRNRASAMADEMDVALDSNEKKKSSKPKKRKKKVIGKIKKLKETSTSLNIGDVINLSEEPWNQCAGIYSCKALKRPGFCKRAVANSDTKEQQGTGSGTGSILKTFSNSAKTLMEESFLLLNNESILEIKCNKFSINFATVTLVVPVSYLCKLKFRRKESISLFFKPAPEDPLIYMCQDSADAVKQIQIILKRHGVKGKHTNAAMQKAVQIALETISKIQIKEKELENSLNPEIFKVKEIMDLYRQAAENFAIAGDERHETLLVHLHNFLNSPLTVNILDPDVGDEEDEELTDDHAKDAEDLEKAMMEAE